MTEAVCHQRIIREQMMMERPRIVAPSLAGYAVETISRADAKPIILHYEWLRNVGRSTIFVGLISPAREIEGVACFGHGPGGDISQLIGGPALCLERGACVHYAPPNAASFLISYACKLVRSITGVGIFFAYADPMAGEYGAVYQAANWLYLGQGLDRKRMRKRRRFVLAPGADPNVAANWQATRILRQQKPPLKFGSARACGWQIAWRDGKHVYAINLTRERKLWREVLMTELKLRYGKRPADLEYPAPRPELKRKAAVFAQDRKFRIEPPKPPIEDLFRKISSEMA
jgi:hypothetical protein